MLISWINRNLNIFLFTVFFAYNDSWLKCGAFVWRCIPFAILKVWNNFMFATPLPFCTYHLLSHNVFKWCWHVIQIGDTIFRISWKLKLERLFFGYLNFRLMFVSMSYARRLCSSVQFDKFSTWCFELIVLSPSAIKFIGRFEVFK